MPKILSDNAPGKCLIIAEKPSVATDIAKALGGFTKHEDYFESDTYVLSSAIGHLLEIGAPDTHEVKRGKWSFANLPVIPPYFALNPIAKTESRLKLLARLLKRKDVTSIINACDAGREGELIFRLIIQHTKAKQSIKRLWLRSMTADSIRAGFTSLRLDKDMQPLADAARCRAEADWLVGINGTRAMTAFNSKDGGFFLTTVGRVQTPTLSIVVEREESIRRFISKNYWEVKAQFIAASGPYIGRYFDPKFKKDEDDSEKRETRIWDKVQAENIIFICNKQYGQVKEESKSSTQIAPALFDLTSLQREANARFGFSAKNTLGLAQALYEKHKVLTYPRTDSRALPEDYLDTVKETLVALGKHTSEFAPHAEQILKNDWIKSNKSNKRIFNNAKISDHFAIIPTAQVLLKNLSEPEEKLYTLVTQRFLAVFFPAAEYLITTRITTVKDFEFKTSGKILTYAGWLSVYGKEEVSSIANANLNSVAIGESVLTDTIELTALQTTAPARYSEATLLSAMEGAGKLIDEDELREAMLGKGLGTAATRASIIEGLLNEKYIVREVRELIPTAKAFQLLTLLRGLKINELTLPQLTGAWEYKLAQIEQNKIQRETFMQEISDMTSNLVARTKEYDSDNIPGDYAIIVSPCPACGASMHENYRRYSCASCDFSFSKTPGGRQFETFEVETLLTTRSVGPLVGFRSKMGHPFAAVLKLNKDDRDSSYKVEFDFGNNAADPEETVDFTGQESVGNCPKCASDVYEYGMRYICCKALSVPKACDFSTGKIILQQEISPEQIRKLLDAGKTDLLTGFRSSRTGRNFKAFLVKENSGKIGFEFMTRTSTKSEVTPSLAKTKAEMKVKITKETKETKAAKATKTVKTKISKNKKIASN